MIQKCLGYFLVFWLLCLTPAFAQTTYPVQVNVHLLPPYSLYLSDYNSSSRDKLTVTLINRDQLKPTVAVKLRMTITAPGGIRIQTHPNAYIQPTLVEAGAPVRLTQEDLAPYFRSENITTTGFLAGGKLPEGMVEFCFQAVEAYTGQVLSASTCSRAWITSQKPPLLSLPRNVESIAFREPLNILFQWTPLHQGITNVEYDFILKELWDNGMTPQAAFPYSPEIYRETTRGTSIIYGAMAPALLSGKTYAWCVRAKARDGIEETNVFQNDGYSEIRWFTLQDNCNPPEYVEASAERKRINLQWNTLPQYIGFTVAYRLKSTDGTAQNEWKELQTKEPGAVLYGLQSGGTYEYRVANICMAGTPVYTDIFNITVPNSDSARLAQCGILPAVNLTNQTPLKELKTGEEFKAGDFPITTISVSGAGGTFTGKGFTIIPWLNDAKVAVEFKNIKINSDYQMTDGFVEAMYDKNEGQIGNLDDVFEGGFDVGNVKTGLTKADYKFDFSIPGVEAFALNDEGELVITDSEGTPHTVTPEDKEGTGNEGNKAVVFPMTVQDKDGNVYKVEKVPVTEDGVTKEVAKATKLGTIGQPLPPGSFDATQLDGDKAIVTFTKGNGKYAFDTWETYYDKISLIEDKYEKLYDNYYAPWKLMIDGQTDVINATIVIKDNTIKPENVIFITPTGTKYQATRDGNNYTIEITSGPVGDVQELYALYPKGDDKYYTLGKIGIATYQAQSYEVVLVSVNNATVDYNDIERELNDIYSSVGVRWTVQRDEFSFTDDKLFEDNTGLSTYNDAMRALNDAYQAARPGFKSNANYLFFLKATGTQDPGNRDFTGFMPRGAQFGYVFTSEVEDVDEPLVSAHELGHGRWKLYHPFDKHYGSFPEGRNGNNLLGYGGGRHLAKWQWDQMNDPALVVSMFEGDDRSAAKGDKFIPLTEAATFYTVDGKCMVLPKGAMILYYCGADASYLVNEPYLKRFKVGDKEYEMKVGGIWGSGFTDFQGYLEKGKTNTFYPASATPPTGKTKYDLYLTYQTDVNNKKSLTLSKIQVAKLPETFKNGTSAPQGHGFLDKGSDGSAEIEINGLDFTYDCSGASELAYKKLGDQMKAGLKNQPNTAFVLEDCNTGAKQVITAEGAPTGTTNKNVISIRLCDGKLVVKDVKYPPLNKNPKLEGVTQQQLEQEIKKRLQEELNQAQNGGTGAPGPPTPPKMTPDGEARKIDKSNLWAFVPEVVDLGKNIYEEAALPADYWNPEEPGYKESLIQMPGMVAGLSDGMIEEATEKLQLIKLGLDLATKPEILEKGWEKVKNLKWSDIRDGAKGMVQGKIDKYANGGPVAFHEAGKDVVMVASSFFGGLTPADATGGGKELGDAVEDKLRRNLDETSTPDANVTKTGGGSTTADGGASNPGGSNTGSNTGSSSNGSNNGSGSGSNSGTDGNSSGSNNGSNSGSGDSSNPDGDSSKPNNDSSKPDEDGTKKDNDDDTNKSKRKKYASVDEMVKDITDNRHKIRDNIKSLPESEDLARQYFNKHKNDMTGEITDDFDTWFEKAFTYEKATLNFEAHHMLPIEIIEKNKKFQNLLFEMNQKGADFDYNGIVNGMMIQKKSINLDITGHSSHPKYTEALNKRITEIIDNAGKDRDGAFGEIKALIGTAKDKLKDEVILGTKNVNEIVDF